MRSHLLNGAFFFYTELQCFAEYKIRTVIQQYLVYANNCQKVATKQFTNERNIWLSLSMD